MGSPDPLDGATIAEADPSLRPVDGPLRGLHRRLPAVWRGRLAVAVGGLLGTALRAGVVALLPASSGGWPWGTFVANLTGALLLGYLVTRLQAAASRTTLTVPLLCTGLLGSYTTFSTFVVEVSDLMMGGRVAVALGYGVASVLVGFTMAQLGIHLAERHL